jgi:hypothetical protein
MIKAMVFDNLLSWYQKVIKNGNYSRPFQVSLFFLRV